MRDQKHGRNLRFAWRVTVLLVNGLGLIFLVLTLLAALAAYIVLPHLADSSAVRALLIQRLEDRLHRPVSVGQIIFAPQGVKVAAIEIANKNPGEGQLLDGESALVTIRILPLLEKRLEIKTVRVFHPVIRLVREKDGSWSFSDILRSTAPAQAQPLFLSLPISFDSSKTVIQNAAVVIDDRYRKRTITFSRLDAVLKSPDAARPFPFSTSFATSFDMQGRKITALCQAEGTLDLSGLKLSSASLDAPSASIDLDGAIFNGSLGLRNFLHPSVTGEFLAPVLSRDWLSKQSGRPAAFPLPQSRWSFELDFPSAQRMHVPFLNLAARDFSAAADGEVDFSSSPFYLQANIQISSAPLQNFSFLAPAISRDQIRGLLEASASVNGPWNKLQADTANIRLSGFSARVKIFSLAADSILVASSGDFSRFAFFVDNGTLGAFGQALTGAALQATLIKNRFSVSRLAFDWNGGRASIRGSIRDLAHPNQVQIQASIDALSWSQAQKLTLNIAAYLAQIRAAPPLAAPSPTRHWVAFFKYHIPRRFPATSGRLDIGMVKDNNFWFKNAALIWDLRGVTPKLNTADGEIRLRLGPGHFDNLQSIIGSSKFMEVVFLPYIYMHKMNSFSVLSTATAYPDTFDFNRIEGQYSAHNGLVRTRFFHVDSPQLAAFAQGEADFAKETVDMEVLTRLSHYDAPLPEWWVDELGRPAIGFWVKGSLDYPAIQPRLQKMGAQEIEQALAKAMALARTRLSGESK